MGPGGFESIKMIKSQSLSVNSEGPADVKVTDEFVVLICWLKVALWVRDPVGLIAKITVVRLVSITILRTTISVILLFLDKA